MDVLTMRSVRSKGWTGVLVILAVLWTLASTAASGGAGASQEQTIEHLTAAIVLTFARFVEWPAEGFSTAAAPIVVGIIADEPVALALEAGARGKNVAGRTIAVKRLRWDSEVGDLHMLFLGEAEKRHLGVVLERARARPIVTVSSLSEFGRSGGMITLTIANGRLTFAVNSHATASSSVRLSSFLLSHATKVSAESGGGLR
jgi:hypothetical protein